MNASVERVLKRTAERKAAGVNQEYPHHAKPGSTPVKSIRRELPCIYIGDPAGPKGWHICENDSEPLGMVVCKCKGCGPRCPAYTPKSP